MQKKKPVALLLVLAGCDSDTAREHPLHAVSSSRVILIGGDSPGERLVWWNFVSSGRERIETAKDLRRAGELAPVPGEDELTPVPEG